MASLLSRRRSVATAEGPSEDEIFGGGEPEAPAPDEAAPSAASASSEKPSEPDEFDIAAEVVTGVSVDDTASDPAAAENADASKADAPVEDAAPENPEEDAEKTKEEALIAEYRRQTGESEEQARNWLAAAKAQKAPQNEAERPEEDRRQDPRMQQRPPVPGSALAGLVNGVGGLGAGVLRGIKKTAVEGTNAALRGTGVNVAAGLTPEKVRDRLFSQWHRDYEAGKRGMARTTEDIIKAAAAYNQLIKTGAPGRELEKIAKSQGTDIQTLISDVTAGKVQDNDAKAAVDALRADPHVQKAWSKFETSVQAYGDHLGAVKHNLTQLSTNKSDRVSLEVEQAALGEIVRKHEKVEKPFELPANPISGDGQKADGKSPMKSVWDQFMEMSQNGLSFIQNLFEKVANFVAQKFGR